MVGNNHSWDIQEIFWENGKFSCATLGNVKNGKGFSLVPMKLGNDWDEMYNLIAKKYGDYIHRFKKESEAKEAFKSLLEELI